MRIQDLPAFKARWGLQVTGGDPDLEGEPWTPKVYLVEAQAAVWTAKVSKGHEKREREAGVR